MCYSFLVLRFALGLGGILVLACSLIGRVGTLCKEKSDARETVTKEINELDHVWVARCSVKYLHHQQMHGEIGVNGFAVE